MTKIEFNKILPPDLRLSKTYIRIFINSQPYCVYLKVTRPLPVIQGLIYIIRYKSTQCISSADCIKIASELNNINKL